MRRRPFVRWVGVAAVVAIGLYFVLDVVALQYMQSRGSAGIAQELAAESATLKLGSVPFLPSYLGGHTNGVEAKVRAATAEGGFGVQSINVRAREMKFSAGKMFSLARSLFSTRTKVTLVEPIALIDIGEADLRDYIIRHIPSVGDVQIKGSGIEVRFNIPQREGISSSTSGPSPSPTATPNAEDLLTKPARYLPRVEARRFVLTLTSVSQVNSRYHDDAFRIERLIKLPMVPAGMTSDVRLGKGVITLDCEGKAVTLEVGEGPS
jgi:hypothetical protein